jgi:flagellar biosynthesis protein FlhG
MNRSGMDQADGLRRLFRAAPPEMLAVLPCGAVTTPWVAGQLQARARAGQQILVLDEWQASGNLADCLGVSPRFDLLQAVEGQVSEAQCVMEVMPGLRLAQVGRLAQALGTERIITQRTLAHLQGLQAGCDEWLLLAQSGDMQGLSPFVLAAPRLVLVVDAHPMSVTAAWTSLKRVVRASPLKAFAICHAGEHDARSSEVLSNFCSLAASRLSVQVDQVGSLGEALALGGEGKGAAAGFMQRLLHLCRSPVGKPAENRFPGNPVYVRMSVP